PAGISSHPISKSSSSFFSDKVLLEFPDAGFFMPVPPDGEPARQFVGGTLRPCGRLRSELVPSVLRARLWKSRRARPSSGRGASAGSNGRVGGGPAICK